MVPSLRGGSLWSFVSVRRTGRSRELLVSPETSRLRDMLIVFSYLRDTIQTVIRGLCYEDTSFYHIVVPLIFNVVLI